MSQQKLGKFGDIYKVVFYKIRQRFNNGADIRMEVERRRLLCLCHSISLGVGIHTCCTSAGICRLVHGSTIPGGFKCCTFSAFLRCSAVILVQAEGVQRVPVDGKTGFEIGGTTERAERAGVAGVVVMVLVILVVLEA